jgi:hypothetical protein
MRRLVPLLFAVLAAGVLAGAAPAARDCIPFDPADHTLCTQHFAVHYLTDATQPSYATETQAGDIAAWAEQAYAAYTSWGYAPPVLGPDGYLDIWVKDLSGPPAFESEWESFGAGPGPSNGDFFLAAPTSQLTGYATANHVTLDQEEQQEIALNVFHLFQLAVWTPTTDGDLWLANGAATWAAFHASPFAPTMAVGNPDIALDCSETISAHKMCDPNLYDDAGFARWAFFDLLATKYGNDFLKTVFANAAAGQAGTTALANALVAKGTTLDAVYIDFVNRFMSGAIGPAVLTGLRPPAYADVLTGAQAVTTAKTVAFVPANHLAARYVTFARGDGDGSHACYAATLTVNVTIPSGTNSQPYFFWDVPGSTPQALSISGTNATITVPWDTCAWGSTRGWLSLPNASTAAPYVDGAGFLVSYSTTVDTNTPATATPPPAATSVWGSTVPVPTSDVPPSIDVFGPELLKLSATDPTIRLIVQSSGPGMLTATLGSTVLGTGSLRSGNNDLRFAVPKAMLTSLRRSAADANVLTLTPLAPTGSATGSPVTLHVAIAPAPAKKKHAKHKTK